MPPGEHYRRPIRMTREPRIAREMIAEAEPFHAAYRAWPPETDMKPRHQKRRAELYLVI